MSFLQVFLKILIIMVVLISFMLPGYILKKAKMLGEGAMLALSNILLYVCQPLLTIKAFAVNPIAPSMKIALNMLAVFILALIGMLAFYLLSRLVFKGMKNLKRKDVYSFVAVFSNCGFIGIPFVDMFTDGNSEAIMYVAVYNFAFILLAWTLGVYLMTQNKKDINIKAALLNPSMIGGYIGLLFFFVPKINIFNMESLPELKQIPVCFSDMTSVLSMFIVGVRMASMPIKSIFVKPGAYAACFLRLIASPLIMFGLTLLAGLFIDLPKNTAALALVVAAAMSPASSCVAYAEKFNGDGEAAASAFILGTLSAVITVPVLMALLSSFFGL